MGGDRKRAKSAHNLSGPLVPLQYKIRPLSEMRLRARCALHTSRALAGRWQRFRLPVELHALGGHAVQ